MRGREGDGEEVVQGSRWFANKAKHASTICTHGAAFRLVPEVELVILEVPGFN